RDVLSAFFWLASLWAYAAYGEKSKLQSPEEEVQSSMFKVQSEKPQVTRRRSKTTFFYLLSLVFFALGLMSKAMVVTLPCVLLLIDFWPLRRFRLAAADAQRIRRVLIEK